MSGEGYSPSREQWDQTEERERGEKDFREELQAMNATFLTESHKPLVIFATGLNRSIEMHTAMNRGSVELMKDAETARRIQLEIAGKLQELEGLKFGATVQ